MGTLGSWFSSLLASTSLAVALLSEATKLESTPIGHRRCSVMQRLHEIMRNAVKNLWIAVRMVAYAIIQLVAALAVYAIIALAVVLLWELVSERLVGSHDMLADIKNAPGGMVWH